VRCAADGASSLFGSGEAGGFEACVAGTIGALTGGIESRTAAIAPDTVRGGGGVLDRCVGICTAANRAELAARRAIGSSAGRSRSNA
jgi:hypothetical protein